MMESEVMRCTDTSDACMYFIYVYLYYADINLVVCFAHVSDADLDMSSVIV